MRDALASVLPLAIAIAASPFPIVPVIILLLTERPRVTAGAFLLGWVAGILGVVLCFSALAAVLEQGTTPTWASWLRVVLGSVLVVLGLRAWARRGSDTTPPGWMQALDDAGPGTALRLGLLLSAANPKVLLLAAAAGLAVGAVPLEPVEVVVVALAFTAVASVSVATPVLLHLVAGRRVTGALAATRTWLLANNAAVLAVVMVVIGLGLVAKGAGEL